MEDMGGGLTCSKFLDGPSTNCPCGPTSVGVPVLSAAAVPGLCVLDWGWLICRGSSCGPDLLCWSVVSPCCCSMSACGEIGCGQNPRLSGKVQGDADVSVCCYHVVTVGGKHGAAVPLNADDHPSEVYDSSWGPGVGRNPSCVWVWTGWCRSCYLHL